MLTVTHSLELEDLIEAYQARRRRVVRDARSFHLRLGEREKAPADSFSRGFRCCSSSTRGALDARPAATATTGSC